MKINKFIMAAVSVAITLLSCESQFADNLSEVVTIVAENEQINSDTRTVIDDESLKISWLANDAISVFFGASESSRFVTEASGIKAQFKGSVGVITGGGDDLKDDTSLWGVYPYKSTTTCDGTSITYTLQSDQEAKENSFADDLFPQIARSQNFFMAFYNLCGSFRFTLSRDDIVKVTLSGNNGESLAGKVIATMPLGGVPKVLDVLDGSATLTMTVPNGECFQSGVNYYFVLYPTEFTKGLTLTFYTEDSRATFNYNGSYTLARNQFVLFDKLDGKLNFEKYVDPNRNIVFADTYTKETCVKAFDEDGDGELSYREAAAVTDLSLVKLRQMGTINSFDEFQYFTSITSIPEDYFNSTRIDKITLPKSLKSIEDYAFANCTRLSSVTFPESLTSIGQNAFRECTSLLSVTLPESLTSI